jgi:1,4-dihydroxy-2-naphthoyl-CoA synthase
VPRPWAGPEILTIGEVAQGFQIARRISRRPVKISRPRPIARATRALFPIGPNAVRGQTARREWHNRRQVDVLSGAGQIRKSRKSVVVEGVRVGGVDEHRVTCQLQETGIAAELPML